MKRFRRRFQFPSETKIRLPHQGEKASVFAHVTCVSMRPIFSVVYVFPFILSFTNY